MLVSRLLLLAQLSIVLASGISSEEEDSSMLLSDAIVPHSPMSTVLQESKGSGEEKMEDIKAPVELLPQPLSLEKQHELACMTLKKKAQELKLLLSDQGGPEALCGLLWNPEKVVNVDMDSIIEHDYDFNTYIHTDLIKDGKAGQMLVLPKETGYLPLSLQINSSRYTLIHVIARVTNQFDEVLLCNSFDVDKKGIILEAFGHVPFSGKANVDCFKYFATTRSTYSLPSGIDDIHGTMLKYDYGIYRYDGPLKRPFDIKPLPYLYGDGFNTVADMFNEEGFGVEIVRQSLRLIWFIQLWEAVQKEEAAFANNSLESIRFKLRDLKGKESDTEREETIEILKEVSKFIQSHFNSYFDHDLPFLSLLKAEEPKMKNAHFLSENNLCYDVSKNDGNTCDGPLDELFFYFPSKIVKEGLPQFTAINCAGEEKPLELIAAMGQGILYTFGTSYDEVYDDEMFEMACYFDTFQEHIINTPFRGELSSLIAINERRHRYFYIFRFVQQQRHTNTKSASNIKSHSH